MRVIDSIDAIQSRHAAGETIESLAWDYELPVLAIEPALCGEALMRATKESRIRVGKDSA